MNKFYNPKDIPAERLEPVDRMIKIMQDAGVKAFADCNEWESAICALILALEPKCRTYRFMEALPFGRDNLSEEDVLNTMARLGYFSRRIETRADKIDPRLLPALFVGADGQPTILLGFEEDGRAKVFRNNALSYLQTGRRALSATGHAYVFERYDENRPSTSKFVRSGTNYGWFRALLGRFHGTFAQILSAGLVINLVSLTTPLMIMLVYNRVIATGTPDVLPMILLGMGLAVIFEAFLRGVRSRGLSWIAARMDNIVGNKIFAHMVGLPPSMIERASVSSQIARIKTFESIRDFFCSSVFLSLIELPFVALAALAIYAIAGPLVLVPLAMCAVYLLFFYVVYKQVKKSIRLAAKASTARQQFAIETFEKIRGVRAYGLTDLWETKFRDLSGKEMMAHFRLNFLGMAGETLGNTLTVIAAILTVSLGTHMIWAGTLSTGALVATMILVWRVITPFYSICTMVPRMEQLRQSVIQVNTLMDIETEHQTAKFASVLPAIKGHVVFTNVALKYGDDADPVLSNIDFEARAGDLVAITGENGAGKSSLLKMIKGLYRPTAGSVLIDGFDIRQLDAPAFRKQIAYVPQQPDFFDGTIIDNMRLCNPIASLEDINAALDLADAQDDIARLSNGLNTRIGRYSAATLPGNLALRLSLARLYLHTAPVLLLDEVPNVLLTGRAGKNLKDYLARNKGSRTCFLITYRDDFLRMADTVILLRRGETPLIGPANRMMTLTTEALA